MYYQVTSLVSVTCITFLCNSKIDPVVYSFRDINYLFRCAVRRPTSSACHTWWTDNCSNSIAISTQLLDWKRALLDCLEALAATGPALYRRCSWFSFRALTSKTNICSIKYYCFLCAFYSLHKINLKIKHNILSLCLRFLLCTILVSTKHLFKFIKNVPEALAIGCFPFSKWIFALEVVLLLFIPCNTSRVINSSFLFIT